MSKSSNGWLPMAGEVVVRGLESKSHWLVGTLFGQCGARSAKIYMRPKKAVPNAQHASDDAVRTPLKRASTIRAHKLSNTTTVNMPAAQIRSRIKFMARSPHQFDLIAQLGGHGAQRLIKIRIIDTFDNAGLLGHVVLAMFIQVNAILYDVIDTLQT